MSTAALPTPADYLASDALGVALQSGPYRAEDYWALPEGEPVELIRGELVMSPAPNFNHQVVSLVLCDVFFRAAKRGRGKAAAAPVDVVLSADSIVQPDIIYVAQSRRKIVRKRVEGSPDIVVEILSESNAQRDRLHKVTLYAQHGVAEVWIVDPVAKTFEFLLLGADGKYQLTPGAERRYASPRCPEVEFELAAFWKEVVELSTDEEE
jgi:Uma2 family endonuclease